MLRYCAWIEIAPCPSLQMIALEVTEAPLTYDCLPREGKHNRTADEEDLLLHVVSGMSCFQLFNQEPSTRSYRCPARVESVFSR